MCVSVLEEGERKGERVDKGVLVCPCMSVLLFVEYTNVRQAEA